MGTLYDRSFVLLDSRDVNSVETGAPHPNPLPWGEGEESGDAFLS